MESDDEFFSQLKLNIKNTRLNIDLRGLIANYYSGKDLRNLLSDRFDDVEQEFLTANKYNFELLQELGYVCTKL